MDHKQIMLHAIDLANNGIGKVNPNPLVGAVIVKNNEIIGEGYHEKYGSLHAERNALANCRESPNGATMYVTLEPCCHFGKTPPCTKAIVESGISKVYIATLDPNPLVRGKGIEQLKQNGIEVEVGICEEESKRQNEVFLHYIQTKMPYVVLKNAMTMDGKIATVAGKSKWITGEVARSKVHEDRNRYSGIMVGVGTILADDPMLNCRAIGGRNPIRIICDTNLRTPVTSQIIQTAQEIPTILATACVDTQKHSDYTSLGAQILQVPLKGKSIDLTALMLLLGESKIDSILLEGGSTLNFSALQNKLVNKIQTYLSPKIFGGEVAKTPVGGIGILEVDDCIKLINQTISWLGDDILIESEVQK